jgi:hypothetical protein
VLHFAIFIELVSFGVLVSPYSIKKVIFISRSLILGIKIKLVWVIEF